MQDIELAQRQDKLLRDNRALRQFVEGFGFDADMVVDQLSSDQLDHCKEMSLRALKVTRDFSRPIFTTAGANEANKWLDQLQKK